MSNGDKVFGVARLAYYASFVYLGLALCALCFAFGFDYGKSIKADEVEFSCLLDHRVTINGTDFLCVVNEVTHEQPQHMRAPKHSTDKGAI